MLDRIIFGDNQFFGVNHMSEERGMERLRRFQDINEIIKVIDIAIDEGIKAFSFSTHDRVAEICDHFRANPSRYSDIRLYPALPYAHKYASLVNDKGIVGAFSDIVLKDQSTHQILSTLSRGGKALFKQDSIEIMKLLIDAELKMFRGLNIKVVFLQNIVTDLFLGMKTPEIFLEFSDYIENKYHAKAGFITLNMPKLVDFLLEIGMENPIICSAINKDGFQMNPSREIYEKTLSEKPFTPLAMSVMAAGAIPPKEALEYVGNLHGIQSILFGASTAANIRQTKQLLESKGIES
jgi:hypothetical protein